MNVVFLSPHFPPTWYQFAVALRRAGATVLGIGDAPFEELRTELREALTEYYRVSDLGNYDELLRAVGWFTHRHGRIDRIDSLNEHWLEVEASLRTDFNVEGIRAESVALVKRKSLMKERFERAGLTPARGRVCRTSAELRDFIAAVGYPVVAKPDIGVGAARTYKLDDEVDVDHYLLDKPATDYIIEEFIEGTIVTYDGLCNRRGDVVFATSLTYSVGVLEQYRRSQITFVVGQGEYEAGAIADTRAVQEILWAKGVPATFDYWGHDVERHWRWWAQMLRHNVGRMLAERSEG